MDTLHPLTAEHERLAADLAARGVEFVTGAWIDINGRSRSKVVPVGHLPNLLAGSERYTPRGMDRVGRMMPDEDECVAVPDLDTLQVAPWDPRYAWMAADLVYGGREPYALCPRSILKRQLGLAADAGYRLDLGVEMELYAFRPGMAADPRRPDGYLQPVARSGSLAPSPAYDLEAAMDADAFLGQMARHLDTCGFEVFSFDTEGGDGQYEFDFAHDEALRTADKVSFLRLMAKQVAKQAGLVATFMPKPYSGAWGSGAHLNLSLNDAETGQNRFRDAADARGRGWSKEAYGFVAGLLRHAPALAAIATPTVNSYKRLTPRLDDGSVSWAPIWAAYGHNNRSCMVRLPENRPAIENRSVDTAANVYLAAALMLAAGLEGIREGHDPGDPVTDLAYDPVAGPEGATRLPRNLGEAIDAFAADPLVHEALPPAFVAAYVETKRAEWDDYHRAVGAWERDRYLLDL
jgi:glutamine synthetase